MKKTYQFLTWISIALFFIQCGGGTKDGNSTDTTKQENTKSEEKESVDKDKGEACKDEQNINFKVSAYKYEMKGDFTFDGKFEVKKSWYVLGEGSYTENGKTDKVEKMTIYLANYDNAEKDEPSKDGEMKIETILYARATKLVAGAYEHSGSGVPLYSSSKILTNKGSVYFNWIVGMEKQGTVNVKGMDGKAVCGEYNLKVDKADNDMIGTVVLNGSFYAEKK